MALTQLADIIEPTTFMEYVRLRTTELSALWQSGIIRPDPRIDALAKSAGGTLFQMPFFNALSGSSESNVGSDAPGTSATAQKITAGNDIAVKHFRNKSWSSADLSSVVAGDDPMLVIGDQVAQYWTEDLQRTLIASLTGVFADNDANDSDDMIIKVATDSASAITADELIDADKVLDAAQTMGDAKSALTAIAMHSVVHTRLRKLNLIADIPDSEGNIMFSTYLNKRVIIDDLCPAVAGTNRVSYTTYLFAEGAVGWGEGTPRVPVEVEREAAQGNGEGVETLHSRRHFILHPRGIKFTNSSVASTSPTNAELAAAANWDRVYPRKLVRMAALITNG